MSEPIAIAPTERVSTKVTLKVEHLVTVSINGDSSMSMEDLKTKALAEYHRDPRTNTGRTEDTWRFQFANRSNIHVGPEGVSIARIEVTTS